MNLERYLLAATWASCALAAMAVVIRKDMRMREEAWAFVCAFSAKSGRDTWLVSRGDLSPENHLDSDVGLELWGGLDF